MDDSTTDPAEPGADATAAVAVKQAAALLAHPTVAVAVVERGYVRRSNAAWNALFALPAGVSVESHVFTLFPSAHSADRFDQLLRSGGASSSEPHRIEHMMVRRDGVPFMAEVIVHSRHDEVDSATIGDAVWQVRDVTAELALRRELRDLEDYYRTLASFQWDLTFVIDRRDCISFASPSVETAFGRRAHTLLGEPFAALLAPSGAVSGMQWIRGARERRDEPSESRRLVARHADGSERVLACRVRNCVETPRIQGLVLNARDVTAEVEREQRDRVAHERARVLRERVFEVAATEAGSTEERIAQLLEAACATSGASAAQLWMVAERGDRALCVQARPEGSRSSDGDLPGATVAFARSTEHGRALGLQRPVVIDDARTSTAIGEELREDLRAGGFGAFVDLPIARDGSLAGFLRIAHGPGPLAWGDDEVDFCAGVALLVAAALGGRSSDGARDGEARRDPLTLLPDRASGEALLDERLESARADARDLLVVVIGLDRFKAVNADHGRAVGDEALAAVAMLLVELAGDALVARMSGDEFLLVREAHGVADDEFVQRLLERVGAEGLVPGMERRLAASVGTARFPRDGTDGASLLSAADLALADAKAGGGGQARAFDRDVRPQRVGRHESGEAGAGAAEGMEIGLQFRPQISFATGKVVGIEAIARSMPATAAPASRAIAGRESNGALADPSIKSTVTRVCEQIVAWRRAGLDPGVPVSLRIVAAHLRDRRLPATVASALMKSALPARALLLEVDATVLAEADADSERAVRELARLGVPLAIVDFVLDDASLAALRRPEVVQLKIDRRFVHGLPDDAIGGAVVGAAIALGRRLDRRVVAEGVETLAQRERLAELDCDAGQGTFFGDPLPDPEFRELLAARDGASTPISIP